MSHAYAHSPADEADYLRGKETTVAKRALMGDKPCRTHVACDGTRLALDLHEDMGLTVV
ncbi:MAG: hypothetical protein ACYC39_08355 [Thiobacillus sp.]